MPAGNDPIQRRVDRMEVGPSWGTRLAGIEGLRGLAALTVLLGHVELITTGTDFGPGKAIMSLMGHGLTLFFALSGFLLYRPFARALVTEGDAPSLARYSVNRALRIYPAYLVILLVTSLALGTANVAPLAMDGATERAERVGFLTSPLLLALNATMLQNLFPFGVQTGIGVAWSLTVELIFYIVMPLLAVIAVLLVRRRGRGAAFAVLAPAVLLVTGLTTKVATGPLFAGMDEEAARIAQWGGTWSAVLARSFLMHADLFAFGMLAAVLVEVMRRRRTPPGAICKWRVGSVVVGAVAVVASRIGPWGLDDTAFAVASGALIFFVVTPRATGGTSRVARVLDLAPLRYVGLISYSFYLWHVSILWLMERYGVMLPGSAVLAYLGNFLIAAALTIAISSVTYFAVERPALRLKAPIDRIVSRPSASV